MAICYEYKGQNFDSREELERFMMEEYIRENSSVPISEKETPQTEVAEKVETSKINEEENRIITSYPKEIKTENNTYQSDELLQVLKEFDETYDDGTIADQRFKDEPLKSYGMSDKNFEYAKKNKDLLEKILSEEKEVSLLITEIVEYILVENVIEKDRNQLDFFLETTPQTEVAEETKINEEPINIYWGDNQKKELSNFAIRPFKHNIEGDKGSQEYSFQSVEQGFHVYKALTAGRYDIAEEAMKHTSGGKLKSLTSRSNMPMTKEQAKEWDSYSKSAMLNLMYDSYAQNPEAAKTLVDTGNAKLTHTQDNTRWKNDFPEVTMEVRNMLKEEGIGVEKTISTPQTETPQAETATDSSDLSMDELRAKFAEEYKNNDSSQKSAFAPTEEIFNRGNKASHSFLSNHFVENSEEFFNKLSDLISENNYPQKFIRSRIDQEKFAQALLAKVKLNATKNLVESDSVVDVFRALGLMEAKELKHASKTNRIEFNSNIDNFEKLSLAKKIILYRDEFKEHTASYDFILKYFNVNTFIDPKKNKLHETVLFANPGDKVIMDNLMDDFEQMLLDPDQYAADNNISAKQGYLMQSIAKDMMLYDLAVNNFEFTYGAISKIYSADVIKSDPTSEENKILSFLNQSIGSVYQNKDLKSSVGGISLVDLYDYDSEFIPSFSIPNANDKTVTSITPEQVLKKLKSNEFKDERYFFRKLIDSADNFNTFKVYEKPMKDQNEASELPEVIKIPNGNNIDFFHKTQVFFNSENNVYLTNYAKVNGKSQTKLSPVKKTTGKNVLNDQFQPHLGSLSILPFSGSESFVPNGRFKEAVTNFTGEITPSYIKENGDEGYDQDYQHQSVNQIATTSRSRSLEQIDRDSKKLVNVFKKAGIKVNVVYDTTIEQKGTAQWNGDKEVTITINPELATDDTSPHEFSHIFADIVGLDHPVMKRAVAFLKDTALWKEVKRAYPHLSESNLAKEVISTAMGIAAAKKLNKEELSTWQKIKNGIKAFFKKFFRFNSMSPVDELVEMMYNDDLSGYSARLNLEDNLEGWSQVQIPDAAFIEELERQEADKIYTFSSDKVIDSIYVEIQNKKTTLRRQGRPVRFIEKAIKNMKEVAGQDIKMINSLIDYRSDLAQRTTNLYDYVSKMMDTKVRNGKLTSQEEIQLSNAMYELSDNLKTIKNLSKHFAPYLKIFKEHYSVVLNNNKLQEGHPDRKTEEQIIDSFFDKDGLLRGETKMDLLGFSAPTNAEDRKKKFNNALGIAKMGDIAKAIDRISTELYGDGTNREGLLREYMNKQLIPLSSNKDFVEGEIKSLFKLRKTRYTLPYDETSIQMWLDALKDTNNPFVALAIKKYYEGLFMAKKRSQKKIKEYKKRVEDFKAKGFSMESLVDESGRFIDEVDYKKYLELRKQYLVDENENPAKFFIKYHTWHPNYDEINQNLINTYGQESDEYQEWYNKNHGETKNGKIYPIGSMSVPNPEVAEIRNDKFFELNKNKDWAEFRKYLKELVSSQKGSLHSQLLDEGFIPAIPLKGDSIIEEIKENADGFKESVKKLGKHFKGKFLPNIEEDAENKQYVITDEDNNVVDTVPIPFLKFLSKKEKPVFDSTKINSSSYLKEFNKKKEKYNIERRQEQASLVNNNLELTMEVFIGMTETYNYKKQQTSSLMLMRELVKATPLHRNKGMLEVLDFTNKKTTGKDAPSLTEAKNLLQHVDDWLKMVHFEKFDFADEDWQRNIARVLMSITSISSLGLNAFSAFNNVAYGNIQLFTERMAGEYFTTKSWRRASAIANKLPFYNFSNKPDDKDAAIANFFDVVERGKELGDKKGGVIKENDTKEKIINSLFFMQNAGEIQMQNSTLFSVLMETPVKITKEDGSITDGYLYDYMDSVEGNVIVKDNVKVKAENGEWVDVDDRQLARIRQKTYSINQYLHGIYNKEDASTVNKGWIGRLAMHFKKWMRPGFNRRFGSRFGQAFWNESRESLDEGMYVGTAKFLWGAMKNAKTEESMAAQFKTLDKKQQSNIIRTGVEMTAALSLGALAFMLAKIIEGLEPEEDEYLALYAMHYMTQRLYREQLTYSFKANEDAKRTLQSPIASWRFVNDTAKSMAHVMGIPFAGTFMEDIFGNPYYEAGYKKGEHKGLYKLKQMIPLAKTFMQYKALDDTFEIRKQQ